MLDTPQASSNVFILYSDATGTPTSVLEEGIGVKGVRNTCVVTSMTPMTITSGSAGFDRDGLKIKPKLSENKLRITFDLILTKCNFTLVGSFTLGVSSAGNLEQGIEGSKVSLSFKVMCYGLDRVYLGVNSNFVEYNNKLPGHYSVTLNPVSRNGVTGVNIHSDNIRTEESGLTLYDNDSDTGQNRVYYAGTPGTPGLYGVAISANTWEGGHGAEIPAPNPFPPGGGADCHIISIYNGYFKAGDTCPALTGKYATALSPNPSSFPDPYKIQLTLTDMEERKQAVIQPVFDNQGNWIYYEAIFETALSANSTDTIIYRFCGDSDPNDTSGTLGSTWYLHRGRKLDNAEPVWNDRSGYPATKDIQIVDVPCSVDGSDPATYEGKIITPPAGKWADVTVEGDCKYFIDTYEFFNTSILISPDKVFNPATVYANASKAVLVRKIIQTIENREVVLFPQQDAWAIRGSKTVDNVSPKEIQHTLIPYAPPKSEDTTVDFSITNGTRIPQALGKDLSGICIKTDKVAGGIWKRYPLQRLMDPKHYKNLQVIVSASNGYTRKEHTEYLYKNGVRGAIISTYGSSSGQYEAPGASVIIRKENYTNEYNQVEELNTGTRAEIRGKTFDLNGVIYNGDVIASFCGMTTRDGMSIEVSGSEEHIAQIDTEDEVTQVLDLWVDQGEITTTVNLDGKDYEIYKSLHHYIHEVSDSEVIKEGSSFEYKYDMKERGSASGDSGLMDCYLHVGQVDSEKSGRLLTQAVSAYVDVSGSGTMRKTIEEYEETNGVRTYYPHDPVESGVGANIKGWIGEAYARTAHVNSGVGSSNEPEDGTKDDYSKTLRVSKKTAFTWSAHTREFEEVDLGDREKTIEYKNSDDEDREYTYTYKCFALQGNSTRKIQTYAKTEGGYVYFGYNGSSNTASLEILIGTSMEYSYTGNMTYKLGITSEGGGQSEDYPYWSTRERSTKSTTEQSLKGGRYEKYTPISAANADGVATYKVEKIKYKSRNYKYTYDSTTGKGEVIKDYDEEDGSDVLESSVTEEGLTAAELRRRFDAAKKELDYGSNFDLPEGAEDCDWYEEYAEYTDAPLEANSHPCEYEYKYVDTEREGTDIDLSFRT